MKITDKMRLDWMEKENADVVELAGGDHVILQSDEIMGLPPHPRGKTIRQAIDAAIRAGERNKI